MTTPANRTISTPSTRDFLATPRTIRHFVAADGSGSLALLEAVIESLVARRIPRTPLLISGPDGCGKRSLARAVACDLAGRTVELEPTSLRSDAETHAVLRSLDDGDTLVLHRLDEFPRGAQVTLLHGIRHGTIRVTRDGQPFPMDVVTDDAALRLSAFHAVGTTALRAAHIARDFRDFLVFALPRSTAASATSLMRALHANGLVCDGAAAQMLSAFLGAARADMFATVITLTVAHARQAGVTRVDEQMARTITAAAWGFMPAGEAAESLKRHASQWKCAPPEAAARLGIPADVAVALEGVGALELRTARPIAEPDDDE